MLPCASPCALPPPPPRSFPTPHDPPTHPFRFPLAPSPHLPPSSPTFLSFPTVETWGPWFLYALFFGILIWEECWHLDQNAALSAWLLLLITAGAVICSSLFERRLWCRYLCPIGGMNGLFAKMSITEIRARKGVCGGNCTTYHCYKGGPEQPPQGLESAGCPLYSHPAQLTDNRHCVGCMECVKACPHGSVQINLRPPGEARGGGY